MAPSLRFISEQIVWQEVPGETSLAYMISGCPLRCMGCHSPDGWDENKGVILSEDYFKTKLKQYEGFITCVLFLGGEWNENALIPLLKEAQKHNLQTCLYTGYEKVSDALLSQLTYLKTGPWIASLGGLSSLTTNQKMIDIRNKQILNDQFRSNEYVKS